MVVVAIGHHLKVESGELDESDDWDRTCYPDGRDDCWQTNSRKSTLEESRGLEGGSPVCGSQIRLSYHPASDLVKEISGHESEECDSEEEERTRIPLLQHGHDGLAFGITQSLWHGRYRHTVQEHA